MLLSRAAPELWIFLLALAVRLVHFWLYKGDFWHNTPLLDDNVFVSWRDVIQREGFLARSLGAFNLNPAYPYFLAYAGELIGNGVLPIVFLQHLLGALASVLLLRIASESFGSRAGWISGVIGALYGPAVFFESRLLGESFIYLLNICALYLLLRPERPDGVGSGRTKPTAFECLVRAPAQRPRLGAFFAGICLGLSSAFRPTALAFAPFAAAWLYWSLKPRGAKPLAVCLLLFALGVWLPMLPFQLRNRIVDPASGFGLAVASGGVNLYLGNNPEADGLNNPPSFVHYGPGMQYQDFKEEAEKRTGRSLSAREVSGYWTRGTLQWFRDRPRRAWRLVARKMLLFWNHREPPDNFFLSLFDRMTRLGSLPLLAWGFVAPLGLLGGLMSLGRRRLLHAYALTYFGLCAGFYVLARYRFPAAAALIPLAASALVRFHDLARGSQWGKVFGLLLLFAPCLYLARLPLIGEEDPASAHYSMAVVYANQGWKDQAVEEYKAAVSADANFVPAWLNLGLLLDSMGRSEEALAALENAAKREHDPAQSERLKAAVAELKRRPVK
ncbi:MAG: glycosyltransferase family 39 protein [Elusimicrobia bacterium]|nr:glycosyltransferase family 39 protein [Elusimicrobiota bacterium]